LEPNRVGTEQIFCALVNKCWANHEKILGKAIENHPPYREMTRRIAAEEYFAIEKQLYSTTVSWEFWWKTRKGDLEGIGKIKNYPFMALKAFKQGSISKEVLSTILMYKSTVEHADGVKIIPLFIRGKSNPEARELIQQTLMMRQTSNYDGTEVFPNEIKSLFTEEQLDAFFDEMGKKHPIEQRLFIYPDPKSERKNKDIDPQASIVDEITRTAKLNVFFRCNHSVRMVPSLSMMQTYLDIKNGNNAVIINPVFALSSLEDIAHNGLSNTRDMAIPFPGVTLAEVADGYEAIGPDFFLHDFYHAFAASTIPKEHRKDLIQLAFAMDMFMKNSSGLSKKDRQYIEILRDKLIDMEAPPYLLLLRKIEHTYSSEQMFWREVHILIALAQNETALPLNRDVEDQLWSYVFRYFPPPDIETCGLLLKELLVHLNNKNYLRLGIATIFTEEIDIPSPRINEEALLAGLQNSHTREAGETAIIDAFENKEHGAVILANFYEGLALKNGLDVEKYWSQIVQPVVAKEIAKFVKKL
jgi:hypothetical protein